MTQTSQDFINTLLAYSKVWNQQHTEQGDIIGGGDRCRLAGCRGVRVSVRWPDGHLTRPCSFGLSLTSTNELQIG